MSGTPGSALQERLDENARRADIAKRGPEKKSASPAEKVDDAVHAAVRRIAGEPPVGDPHGHAQPSYFPAGAADAVRAGAGPIRIG